MSNEENLIPLNKRSKRAQREIQSKGGKAASAASRKRKALKETMDTLLSMPISNKKDLNAVSKLGFDVEDADNSILVVVALFKKAISGDVAAIKELRSLIDEDSGDIGQLENLIRGLKNDIQ